MQSFSAEVLGETMLLLGKIFGTGQLLEGLGKADSTPVDQEQKRLLLDTTLPHIERFLRRIGLANSLAYISRIRTQLERPEGLSVRDMHNLILQLQERMQDELHVELFLHVPKEQANLYKEVSLFGPHVYSNFPSARFDIEEAGKCLALARSTACVMHLSRVAEVVLHLLARQLKLPPRSDWGKHSPGYRK